MLLAGDLVQVLHGLKIFAMAAGVREPHADAAAPVLLQRQVPLLDRWVFVVDGEGVVEAGCAGGTARGRVERIRKRE